MCPQEKDEVMAKFRADHAARAAGSRQGDGGVEGERGVVVPGLRACLPARNVLDT